LVLIAKKISLRDNGTSVCLSRTLVDSLGFDSGVERQSITQLDLVQETSKSDWSDIPWSRKRLLVAVLFISTLLLIYFCYLLTRPFLPALAWAVVLAILAHPIHSWIRKHIPNDSLATGLCVLIVAMFIVAPATFIFQEILYQARMSLEYIESGKLTKTFQSALDGNSTLSKYSNWIMSQLNLEESTAQLNTLLGKGISKLVGGSALGIVSLLISFLFLFYFLRDRRPITDFIRSLLPLSEGETDRIFVRMYDTLFATIYGTLTVATLQGTLGGLMFWALGLPAPLLWGVIMGLLSIVPVLGSFVIWIPAAIFLAIQGSWTKAVILTFWGTIVIGLIDNLIYPIVVGKRLRLHTITVFIAIVGGLILFGASGLILGPVILTLTDATIDVWRRRTARGNSAVIPTS
jgi:predicted PurR-regulated permease PerM